MTKDCKGTPSDLLRTPSYSRYRCLSKGIRRISLTRALQYEVVLSYPLRGRVLDLGGGERVDYRSLLNCTSYESANTDRAMDPTWVLAVGESLPCSSASFDTVVSFNTLEHIFDVRFVLNEMQRVLKFGGELLITTPFLFPIHAHPNDFFRPTPSWYHHALAEAGFEQVDVVPLSWGPFSTGLTCSGVPGPAKAFRRQIALVIDLLYVTCVLRLRGPRSPSEREAYFQQFATAFFVRAIKSAG